MKNNMPQLFHLLQGGVEVAVVHQHLYNVLQDHTLHTMYHKKGGMPEQIQIARNLEKVWKTIFSIFSTEPTLIFTKIKQPPTDLQPLGSELNQRLKCASFCSTVLLMLVNWDSTREKEWKWGGTDHM